jgi:hypothetical protein
VKRRRRQSGLTSRRSGRLTCVGMREPDDVLARFQIFRSREKLRGPSSPHAKGHFRTPTSDIFDFCRDPAVAPAAGFRPIRAAGVARHLATFPVKPKYGCPLSYWTAWGRPCRAVGAAWAVAMRRVAMPFDECDARNGLVKCIHWRFEGFARSGLGLHCGGCCSTGQVSSP